MCGFLQETAPNHPIDALHEYMLTHVMLIMTVPALVWFLSTDPGDVTIRTALTLTRIVGFGIMIVLTIIAYREESLFESEAFMYKVIGLSSITLVYMVHLFYHSTINVDKRVGNLNSSLHIDLCLSLLCGSVCLVVPYLPAYFLFDQELDELHTYLYRLYGGMMLGYCLLPAFAPRFRASANKRAILFSRALSMLVMLLVTFRKYHNGDIPEGLGGKLMIAVLLILTLPSAIGSMSNEYSSSWDLPWKGLRVPHITAGISPAQNFYQAAKDLKKMGQGSSSPKKHKKAPKRKRSRSRRTRSRARGGSRKR
ncbi:hypothetical protein ACOMHN_067233 [Nucella lapillus]